MAETHSTTPADTLTSAPVVAVALDSITLGVRRRKTLGDLRGLQASIELRGLIHPIIIHNGGELVCGARRLEACRRLGWTTIPARRVKAVSVDDFRALETDENARRLGLSDYESSKERLAEIRQAEADLKAEAEAISVPNRNENSPRSHRATGKPVGRTRGSSPGSKRDIASVTGIAPTQQQTIEKHVALADAYPVFQRNGWKQTNVLVAGEALEKLPKAERLKAAALLDQDAIPPKKVIAVLENLAAMPADQRKPIYAASTSDDPVIRQQALTDAAGLPAVSDAALPYLVKARGDVRQAIGACRMDAFSDRLKECYAHIDQLYQNMVTADQQKRGV